MSSLLSWIILLAAAIYHEKAPFRKDSSLAQPVRLTQTDDTIDASIAAWQTASDGLERPSNRPAAEQVEPFVDQSFERREIVLNGQRIRFRWRRPPHRQANQREPIVVWFHGLDEAGTDNGKQLRWLELMIGTSARPVPCAASIIAWQLPHRRARWDAQDPVHLSDPVTQLHELVQALARYEPVDLERQYVVGISQGALGAWTYAARYREQVAGQLLLAPSINSSWPRDKLPGAPTWAFQSVADGVRAMERTEQLLQSLRVTDTPCHFTLVDSRDHDCWTVALRDYRASRWLLRQRRGASSDNGYGIPIASTTSLLACLFVIRRRRRRVRRVA